MNVARIAKMLLASLYLGGGVFNLTVTPRMLARDPALYSKWVSRPLVPFYKPFFAEVVTPNARLLTVLVALYELVIGGLLFSPGRYAKLGLLGGLLFNILLAPMSVGQAAFNLVLAALHLPLLRQEHRAVITRQGFTP